MPYMLYRVASPSQASRVKTPQLLFRMHLRHLLANIESGGSWGAKITGDDNK